MRFPGLVRKKRIFISLLRILKRLAGVEDKTINLREERKSLWAWVRMNFQI